MKIGDLVEYRTGEKALILELEMLYPRHPESPIRNLVVHWLDKPPRQAYGHEKRKVDVFAVKVISRADR
tara:strand:+ start:122 stop:328 length:207 start_codon:yes stop_codon:yes gene_type:complete